MGLKIETKPFSESMLLSSKVGKNGDSGGSDFGSMLKHAEVKQSEAASELEKYMKMTPAQRMAAAILKSMGITRNNSTPCRPIKRPPSPRRSPRS